MIVIITLTMVLGSLLLLHYALDKKVTYKDLKGRHVVITGGSSGIGKSAAIEAGRLGAHVTIIGRDVGRLEATVKDIVAQCPDPTQKIQYAALDVTSDYKILEKCYSSLEAEIGPIFMLVNCAGMCICGQFEQMKVDDIKHMIDLNYFGTAYSTKYVLPGMKARDEGIILLVSSEAALIGIYGYSAYSASKWAVRGLAEAVSMELVGTGVSMTLSFPPDTDTPGLRSEELTKPEETKLISGTAGLHSPEKVAKQMIYDAMIAKPYSVYTITGFLMSTLFGGTIVGPLHVLLQVFSAGFLRMIIVGVLISFHKIVRDVKLRRSENANENENENANENEHEHEKDKDE